MPDLLFHRAPAPAPEEHSEVSVWVAVAPSEAADGARKVVDRSLVAWLLSLFNDIRPFDLRSWLAPSLLLSLSTLVDLCRERLPVQPVYASFRLSYEWKSVIAEKFKCLRVGCLDVQNRTLPCSSKVELYVS